MGPLKPVKKDATDKRVQAVLDKAKEIASVLQSRNPLSPSLRTELEHLIRTAFPKPAKTTSSSILSGLELRGCEIWNASTNIIRGAEPLGDVQAETEQSAHTAVLLRVFAFMLLDFAYQSYSKRQKDQDKLIRVLKIGVKACKSCLEKGELDLASETIQMCGHHVAAATGDSPLVNLSKDDKDNGRGIMEDLALEVRLLRMIHAWRTERLDLAEHFYEEFTNSQHRQSASLCESAAEVLHQIGRSLLKNKLEELAVKWLKRALATLDSCDVAQLSQDAYEVRLAASVSLVNCFAAQGSPASLQQAHSLIQETFHGLGNRMTFQLLQVKVILASEHVDEEKLNDVLTRVIHSAVLSEHNFITVMKCISRVRKSSLWAACSALQVLITMRLLPDLVVDGTPDATVLAWLEKSCVTHTLYVTNAAEGAYQVAVEGLRTVYDASAQTLNGPLPARATHAIQALIWGAADSKDPGIADAWLEMIRHPLFDSAGQTNKAKIGRKAMTTLLAKGDLDAARETFFQMSETAQNESGTRYLAFKLALQSNDHQLATESLNMVAKKAGRDPAFLYACVFETQQSQMRHIAVAALQAILDKGPSNVHFVPLLRCTARLLVGELDNRERNLDEVMEETLRVFESASTNSQVLIKHDNKKRRAELQWWTKYAYNIALRYCGQAHPEHLIRMLRACTHLMEFYPNDDGPMHHDALHRRSLLCHFLIATALIVLARSHLEGSEERLQCYLEARREIALFVSTCPKVVQENESAKLKSLHRVFNLLKLDLECIINLQQWDQLSDALQGCIKLEGIDRWDTLADIALHVQQKIASIEPDSTTHKRLTELLQKIINDTWKNERDMAKAARWLRISFSYDLLDGTGEFALQLLTQATGMAKKEFERRTYTFPDMELQWLSTKAFNTAVDLLAQGKSARCGPWLDGSLELARYSADNGALHANLTSKRERFDERLKEVGS